MGNVGRRWEMLRDVGRHWGMFWRELAESLYETSIRYSRHGPTQPSPKSNKSQTDPLHSCPKCFGCVCCVLIYHKQAIRPPGPAARQQQQDHWPRWPHVSTQWPHVHCGGIQKSIVHPIHRTLINWNALKPFLVSTNYSLSALWRCTSICGNGILTPSTSNAFFTFSSHENVAFPQRWCHKGCPTILDYS